MKRIFTVIIAVLLSLCASAQTTRPVRAVWYQPVDSFDKWSTRGIDTLIGYESNGGTASLDQYLAAAKASGLRVWLQSTAVRPQDYANATVAGVMNSPDEPDGVGSATPAQMQANYAAIKSAMASAHVNKPVLINFDGNKIPWRPAADYVAYCQAGDIVCCDYYPCNFGSPGNIGAITTFAQKLSVLSDGKPVWECIETGDQLLKQQDWTNANDGTGTPLGPKMRGPTAIEFTAEVKAAFAGGALGLVYFPDQIGAGWVGFDGTPPDVEAAMKLVNGTAAVASSSGSALPAATQATTSPTTRPATQPAFTPGAYLISYDIKRARWSVSRADRPHDAPKLITGADAAIVNGAVARAK